MYVFIMCICICCLFFIYIHMYIHIYVYIYKHGIRHLQREREERKTTAQNKKLLAFDKIQILFFDFGKMSFF